ncbi:hypothetical protein SAMN05660772_02446 [Pasteurella testudinis DSM 23072]|uniref:Hemophilus-specific protein n=1 Tax=Pasteurella testudinis DSM 23072 TaxID=1122938 RepID=A0A1W1UWZ0_9PAST|nr:hypothetical protein [Pasteurella testudinis]SMB85214.1 hypothetical protein SAMN05660772_02446 [Pasteurella testudinis DSM 23072]SUB52135.1 Uncharacterised protein [Pasteurella testudinis]
MNNAPSPQPRHFWSRLFKILLGLLVILIIGIIISYLAVTLMPGTKLQHWFKQTWFYWFLGRLCLYCVIATLINAIHRYTPLPRLFLSLIAITILLLEALNLLYLLG